MASNYIASVPKLKGRENYSEWAFAAENFLILDGLKSCIEGTETDVTNVTQIDFDRGPFIIYTHKGNEAEELWNKLKKLYDDAGFARRITLLRSLISARLKNMDDMASYVNHVIDTSQRLKGTEFNIDEEWVESLLLAELPEKFSPMIMVIKHIGIQITADT